MSENPALGGATELSPALEALGKVEEMIPVPESLP